MNSLWTNESLKISVITVCYNAGNNIEKVLRSVLTQTYPAIEYILIDGGSTDGTLDIIKSNYKKDKIKYISEPDNGIYDAMNKGINLATGEWIFFLGSDDVFFENNVVERIFSNPYDKEDIIYGNVKYLHSGIIYDGPFDHEKISIKNICQQSIFFRKNVFEKIGLFDLRYKIYADHEFNLRWIGAKIPSLYINETVTVYNEKGISGRIIDEVFTKDFDQLLIKNNIISIRSFAALKKQHIRLLNSRKYKIGNFIVAPIVWLKSKFIHIL